MLIIVRNPLEGSFQEFYKEKHSKSRVMLTEIYDFFQVICTPEENLCYYFKLGACLGAAETHDLLFSLRSVFCK